jgi:GT2 family glycosyltransferase
MPRSQSTLSVVMVTYNSAAVVKDALTAVSGESAELIIVDNASSDDTIEVVRTLAPHARIVESGGNLGFSRGVHAGVREASGDRLLLLNPDAVITGDAIRQVLEVFDSRADIGIAAPFVSEGTGEFVTLAGGYEPTIWRMFTHATGLSRLAHFAPFLRGHYLLRGQHSAGGVTELNWVSGGCMFIRRSAWDELGGLTDRWFMYAEDVEFCLRANDRGWRVVLVPWAHATHTVGASSAATETIRTTWLENLFDLYQSHYQAGPVRASIWRLVVGAGYAARAVASRVRAGGDTGTHLGNARRFRAYARAAWKVRRRRLTAEADC